MTQTIIYATTQEQAFSYAEIEQLPRLTTEEEATLLHNLRLAHHAPAAKARLAEGYLPRVLTLARQYDRRYRVITLDDLVQEGSLALMQAIDKCATMPLTKSLRAYVGTVVRSAFARAIATDAPIHMPNSTWHYIHNKGRAHEFAWMQTVSMDRIPTYDDRSLAERVAAPALRLPVEEQQHEAQAEEEATNDQRRLQARLLPSLTERQRQILALRYGLDEADARTHSMTETARLLGEAMKRLRAMRADPAWQKARAIPKAQKQERKEAFNQLRQAYGFSEYALHDFAKAANCAWISVHIDAVMGQTLATRAYRAANRVCLGEAKNVRFRSKGRGLDSVENKRNNTGLRFVLQPAEGGNQGWLVWGKDRLPALIDWHDPVVHHGLRRPIKYARLVRREASSPNAQGADVQGYRYYAQLMVEGKPYQKKKHTVGSDVVGLDLGPSTIAIVPREGEARLVPFCAELKPDARAKRHLQRKLDRQRRANNPQNYDEQGRVKKRGKGKRRLTWKNSKEYLATMRRIARKERKLAAHRKSLHGRLVHEIVRVGNDIRTEKLSYKAWQKQYGKSVGHSAPGMFVDHLRRTVASTGGILSEFSTRTTKLSQYCHGCQNYVKKPLPQRWHHCACGIGPVQRDLYSAFLAAHLDPSDTIPSIAQEDWEGADLRLRAAVEALAQRANEGQVMPRSVGIPRAGARLPASLAPNRLELVYRHGRIEALG